MRTVTALELRGKLGELLDAASAGERILIERDHRPMAVLVSIEEANRLDEDREERRRRSVAALDRLDKFRERMAREHPEPPGAPDSVTLIRHDRSRDDPDYDPNKYDVAMGVTDR
jgi:prevent-host-death family protein